MSFNDPMLKGQKVVITPEMLTKKPAWHSLNVGDKWLIINQPSIVKRVLTGETFIHTFTDGRTQGKMKLIHTDGNDHMCEFMGWNV